MSRPKPAVFDPAGTMDMLAVLGDDDRTSPPPADEDES